MKNSSQARMYVALQHNSDVCAGHHDTSLLAGSFKANQRTSSSRCEAGAATGAHRPANHTLYIAVDPNVLALTKSSMQLASCM
jgi:hypothetical protein